MAEGTTMKFGRLLQNSKRMMLMALLFYFFKLKKCT